MRKLLVTCLFIAVHSPQAKGVGISLNLGVVAKTEGFLLEEMAMDDHIGVRFGSSIYF